MSNLCISPSLCNTGWRAVSLALARLVAAKPHSCDVERLVSASNLLKDDDRCSLNHTTIDAYLHIRLNKPVLADFDVQPAVRAWFGKQRHRAATDADIETAIKQEWYKGVF